MRDHQIFAYWVVAYRMFDCTYLRHLTCLQRVHAPFFTNGRNVLVTSTIPQRLTSARRLNVLTGVHSIGQKESIAALFTNPHSPANMQSERKTESWLIKDLLVKPEPFILFSILFLLAFMNEISDQWKRRVNLFTHKTIDFARCSTIVFFLDACGFS